MNEPTNRDILTAVEALGRDLHAFRDVTEARFGLMGERFESIDQRFESIDQRFNRIDQRFDRIDQRFEGIDQRFEGIDLTLAQHGSALTELAVDVKTIHTTLAEHGRKLDRLERRGERRR